MTRRPINYRQRHAVPRQEWERFVQRQHLINAFLLAIEVLILLVLIVGIPWVLVWAGQR